MANATAVRITDVSELSAQRLPSINSMVARSADEIAAFSDQFLGPGLPMNSFRGPFAPRRMDYPASVNVKILPDKPFDMLRNLAAWDPVRYCIERRKNGIKASKWAIVPEDVDELKTGKYDKACRDLTEYWKMPDPQNRQTWDLWASTLLESSFLWDAATVMRWPRRDNKGVALHRVIDGSTIVPKIDSLGNTPLPPAPAFQQIIKGIPLTEYTSEQILYLVRNPRVDSPYGMSETEWLMICINIALRRDASDMMHWTVGNVPYGFGELPEGWTPAQIEEWGKVWDDMLSGDLAERAKIKWGPHGMNFHEFQERNKGNEDYKFYEWSSRRACAIFGVAPTAYTGSVNRATAETAEEAQGELAEEPLCQWLEQIITNEIRTTQGEPDLCFKFITEKQHNELESAQANKERIFSGQISLDNVLNEAGQDEIGIPPFVLVPGQGIVYLKGQNPAYQKKYEKFFKMQQEEDDATVAPAVAKPPVAPLPGKPGKQLGAANEEEPPTEPAAKGAPGSDLEKINHPHKVKVRGKWQVVDDDGHVYGSHATEAEANKQLAALYVNKVNVPEALADLRKWQRIAKRRLRDGEVQKAFQSEAIPCIIRQAISLRVEAAKDATGIDNAFAVGLQDVEKSDLAREGGWWKQPWGAWQGLAIYRVDGPFCRKHFFVDFTEGGNPAAYMWLPEDEVWIEQTDNAADDAANLLHECTEYLVMTGFHKPEYDDAHAVAASLEAMVRRAAAGLSLTPTAAEVE